MQAWIPVKCSDEQSPYFGLAGVTKCEGAEPGTSLVTFDLDEAGDLVEMEDSDLETL